jgi:histone H3/H4
MEYMTSGAPPTRKRRGVGTGSLKGISDAAIQRIAHKAGVKTVSSLIYDETRDLMKMFLRAIIKDAATYTEHARRKTTTRDDILHASERRGRKIYTSGGEGDTKNCDIFHPAKKPKSKAQEPAKRGELALREMMFYQKQHDCMMISTEPFVRLVRDIASDYKTDLKFTGDALGLLQIATEDFLVRAFEDINLIAIHTGRVGILPKDMHLARLIKYNTGYLD